MNKRQLHWSHISMFTKCAEQYRRRYILGERLRPGVNLIAGTSLHKAAEIDLSRKMESGELAPVEEVTEAARDCVVRSFEDPEGVSLDEKESADGIANVKARTIDEAVKCAALHHAELAPLASPRSIERKFVLEVNGFPFDLAGTIDCDDGDVIWDWKTAAKSPASGEAETSGQLTVYSLAKNTMDCVMPAARLAYVIKTRTPKTVIQETRRRREDFAPFFRALERIALAIDKDVFPFAAWMSPRPWWCDPRWCGYYKTCAGVSTRAMISKGEL